MKLLVDDADIRAIKHIFEYYPVDGITTNPSILSRTQRPPFEVLHEIREFIGPDAQLHVQVVQHDAAGMVADARRIVKECGEGTFVKIPCVPEGFKAIRELAKEGIRTTGTAIYTPMQAYLAAKAGASYAAPYVNNIDNLGLDGLRVACQIHDIFQLHEMDCEVLAASFKNSQQLMTLCAYGIGCATARPETIEDLVKNPSIDASIAKFTRDFVGLTGIESMADL